MGGDGAVIVKDGGGGILLFNNPDKGIKFCRRVMHVQEFWG